MKEWNGRLRIVIVAQDAKRFRALVPFITGSAPAGSDIILALGDSKELWLDARATLLHNQNVSLVRLPYDLPQSDVPTVVVDDYCTYLHKSCLGRLAELSVEKHTVIAANTIGSTRSFYVHNVMGLLPDRLPCSWWNYYIDGLRLGKVPRVFTQAHHVLFQKSLRTGTQSKWLFGITRIVSQEDDVIAPFALPPSSRFVVRASPTLPASNAFYVHGAALAARLTEGEQKDDKSIRSGYLPLLGKSVAALPDALRLGAVPSLDLRRTTICVSSHVSSAKTAGVKCVTSLVDDAGVPKENVLLVVGGSATEQDITHNGVRVLTVRHNSYDHTGIIESAGKTDSDFVFALHDTTYVGSNFPKLLDKSSGRDHHVALLHKGWTNMGLFSREFLVAHNPYIQSLKDISKMRAVLSEQIYPRFAAGVWYQELYQIEPCGFDDPYGDGQLRFRMYCPSLDLYKLQRYFHNSTATRDLLAAHYSPEEPDLESLLGCAEAKSL